MPTREAQFESELKVTKLRTGEWNLIEPLCYYSAIVDSTLCVPAGFITDFASVPRIPLAFLVTGDTAHEAAVVHDWLYVSGIYDRATADAIFREAMKAMGEPAIKNWLMWAGVRLGGWIPWSRHNHAESMD